MVKNSAKNSAKDRIKKRRFLLKLWSAEGRKHNKCYLCGTTEHLQAHHMFEKKLYKALRYDVNNRIILCASCHKFKGQTAYGAFHTSPIAVNKWILDNPLQYFYLCLNKDNEINLDNDDVLIDVEEYIINNTPLFERNVV